MQLQRVGNLKVELEEKEDKGVEWGCGFKGRGKG